MPEVYTTLGSSTLASNYTAASGTMSVVSAATFPASNTFSIRLNSAAVYTVTNVSGTTFSVTLESGSDVNVSSGAAVKEVQTSRSLDAIRSDLSQFGAFSSLPTTTNQKQGNRYKCTDSRYEFLFDGSSWKPFYDGLLVTVPPAASSLTTSINASTITLTDADGMLVDCAGTGAGGENWGLKGKAYPVSSFTFDIGIEILNVLPFRYSYFGIGVSDGTKGIASGVILGGSGLNFFAAKYTNTSTFSAPYTVSSSDPLAFPPGSGGRVFLRWQDDLSATRNMKFGADGANWYEWPNIQGGVSRTDFLTPTSIGILCGQSTNSSSASYSRFAFRIFHWSGI